MRPSTETATRLRALSKELMVSTIYGHWAQLLEQAAIELESRCGPSHEEPTWSKGPSPAVVEKEKTNTWDHLSDFVEVWKAKQAGKWQWYANSRCKYVELRIDMRDGGCIIRDREQVRISPEELAYQYSSTATEEKS